MQYSGRYNLQFSAQIENFGNDFEDTAIWFNKNGNAIPKTASYASSVAVHAGKPGATIMTVNIFDDFVSNDIVSLWWVSLGGTTAISSIAPTNGIPQSPAIIFTVNRVYQ